MKLLILLIGAQGSGKSTYCAEKLKGYTRISQDDQGKDGHRKALNEALENEEPFIVVDRMNHNRQQRGNYLFPAKKKGYVTKIVWLNTERNTCIKRARSRKFHPTLAPEDAEKAIGWYFKSFQVPSTREADELEVIGEPPSFVPVKDIISEIGDRRFIIIGDIHGCFDEMMDILKELNFNEQEDVLVSCGDLVDRGPKVKEVLDYVMALPRFYCVMGNHENKCIRYFEGKPVKVSNGMRATIDAFENGKPPEKTLDFLRDMPIIIKTPAGYVVHAGFDPLMLPEEQQKDDCLYMRYYGGRSYFDSFDGVIWHKLWPKEYPRVFYGHIPELSGPDLPNITSLDGGCVFGDYLKAYDSKDGIVHYINAKKVYSTNEFTEAVTTCPAEAVSKREEYMVAGLIRGDRTDDGKFGIYTYADQCVFDNAWDEITKNSRGHIFDLKTGECIAWPFPKFFNLGENKDSMYEGFDWSKPHSIYEKLDGCLGILFRHEGQFKVASRGSFHSDMSQWATKFIQKFDLTWLPEEVTLVFEIIAPVSKIILDYGGQETLMVLAAFDRRNGTEYSRKTVEEWAAKIGLPVVQKYDLTIQNCLELQKTAEGREGFVVVFEDGRRVKVKMDWYMALAKISSRLSPISVWEIMKDGKAQDSYMIKIPEELRHLANEYKNMLESQYAKIKEEILISCRPLVEKHGKNRKAVAMDREHLKGTPSYKAIFSILDNREADLDKMIMNEIYPASNEMKAIK